MTHEELATKLSEHYQKHQLELGVAMFREFVIAKLEKSGE
jgi:hypothetical protein